MHLRHARRKELFKSLQKASKYSGIRDKIANNSLSIYDFDDFE